MTRKKQLFKILLILLIFLPICSSRLFNLLSNNFEFSNAQSQRGSRLGEIDVGGIFKSKLMIKNLNSILELPQKISFNRKLEAIIIIAFQNS